MVTMSALHALTAELHAGFLTLAFVCIMITALCQIAIRLKDRGMPKSLVNLSYKIRGYTEAAGYVGAALGVIGLLLSAWTGMYAWPEDVLLESGIIRNKILLTAFSTVMWCGIVYIRARFGRPLWTCPYMAALYVALAFVAFGVLGTTGSMGAHITQGGSAMDPLWSIIGFDVTSELSLTSDTSAAVALVSMILIVLSLFAARRYDLFAVKMSPETCPAKVKWDEPRIVAEVAQKP